LFWYVPGTHGTHGPPADPADPAEHKQSVTLSCSDAEIPRASELAGQEPEQLPLSDAVSYLSAPHTAQSRTSPIENVPGLHWTHGPPEAPSKPMEHLQSVIKLYGGDEGVSAPLGQLSQVDAPKDPWYSFKPQFVQDVWFPSENVPGLHCEHGPPSGPAAPGAQMQSWTLSWKSEVLPTVRE
jgi:hypothetical protein